MPVSYLINILNHSGQKVAVVHDWNSLTIEKRINSFHTHTLSLSLDDPNVQYFNKDYILQVMRSDVHEDMPWYEEYIGFIRTPSRQITQTNQKIFINYGRSLEDLLHRRSIAWRAPHEFIGAADDVMKQIVRENCGSLATQAMGRIRDAVFPLFEVAADSSQAVGWRGARSYRNVLEVLQEIAQAGSVDFKVDFVEPIGFRFTTHYPQLGSTVNLRFGPEYGNVINPQFTQSATEEVTTLLVAGSGTDAARQVQVVSSAATIETPWNDIELVRDQRNESNATSLTATANSELAKLGEQRNFTFQLVQTPTTMYGRDYNLGDKIRVSFLNLFNEYRKITGVNISVGRDRGEEITCTFGELPPPTEEELIRTISNRLHALEHSGSI